MNLFLDAQYVMYIVLFIAVVLLILFIIILFNIMKNKNDNNIIKYIKELKDVEKNILNENNNHYGKLNEEIIKKIDVLRDANDKKLKDIIETNENKLNSIQSTMNEKLDKSLNERLDSSFKNIGDELNNLNNMLGKLQTLSINVDNLQKTFSNVKERGIYGEMQLQSILENIMPREQYEVQYKIDDGRIVDFAIKIPKKGSNDFIYLPLDSKFPSDTYLEIVNASKENNTDVLKESINKLKDEIKKQAKSISEKYIIPPKTTDFAIMFLPTEGLFSEVLRIDNLTAEIERNYKIIIVGPTNISALLSSLSLGFKYLNISEKAEEVGKVLQSIKSLYGKFTDDIKSIKKELEQAMKATENIEKRNDKIQKKLNSLGEISVDEVKEIIEE